MNDRNQLMELDLIVVLREGLRKNNRMLTGKEATADAESILRRYRDAVREEERERCAKELEAEHQKGATLWFDTAAQFLRGR